jgi:hypothetical protein
VSLKMDGITEQATVFMTYTVEPVAVNGTHQYRIERTPHPFSYAYTLKLVG